MKTFDDFLKKIILQSKKKIQFLIEKRKIMKILTKNAKNYLEQ